MSVQLELKRLRKLRSAITNRESVNRALARGAEGLIKSHFKGIGSTEKNKLGARSTFWLNMFRQTKAGWDSAIAFVEMNRAIALRYFGGVVKPTGSKRYLTIPISKKSYGKSARWFDELEIYTSHLGNKFLVREIKVRKKKQLEFLYLLKERVTHKPNKRILPTATEFQENMASTFKAYLAKASQ